MIFHKRVFWYNFVTDFVSCIQDPNLDQCTKAFVLIHKVRVVKKKIMSEFTRLPIQDDTSETTVGMDYIQSL